MLASSVLKTISFFDSQDLPLTLLEIKSYLGESESSLREIGQVLQSDLSSKVTTDSVFFCLAGREELFEKRRERYTISLKRMRKTKRILFGLRFLPFVRAVAVSGSQAILNSRRESDIDLFVVTSKNRIWLARMLVTLYLQLLGQRRHGQHTKNRFCLNHYIDEQVDIIRDKNLYTAILYASFLPIFGNSYFAKFYSQNIWINEFVSDLVFEWTNNFFNLKRSKLQRVLEVALELTLLAPLINSANRWYQQSRIKPQDHVYVSDQELSFHPDSRGQQILAKFREKSALD